MCPHGFPVCLEIVKISAGGNQEPDEISQVTTNPNNYNMKLLLSAICASFIIAPLSFADCEKGKCGKDKEKKEGTILADCGKCKKDGDADKDKKKEGTIADCGKCKKDGDADKDKKKEGTIADCGKCKKDGDCDKEKKEGTIADCGKCKKDGDADKDKKKEGTLV